MKEKRKGKTPEEIIGRRGQKAQSAGNHGGFVASKRSPISGGEGRREARDSRAREERREARTPRRGAETRRGYVKKPGKGREGKARQGEARRGREGEGWGRDRVGHRGDGGRAGERAGRVRAERSLGTLRGSALLEGFHERDLVIRSDLGRSGSLHKDAN
ncbi:hypothetical protein Mp_1g14430 [Marchantia polymorpha subsp. ruderalis]|uniref:Uncharacterized protein n=2 Tax=Marchantia polymorpha TaxID=3197 RepID=A0AAF6AQ43_MARPO|nr:hypothetical protein MARPO_0179s0024 [Marchantia polymorpha]BBM98563.1 hypothetical protein Mp_1g14430 [Marchantia polymorpha subsp. ruderalis]|eukprot:PTQ27944.1 hypothetical protein MARPO_0179s0024 [Marchantia polymorpha]